MLEKLDLHSAEFSAQYQDRMGRSLPSFNLPKDLTLTLVSGYDVSLRYRVVKRLEALEARSNPALIDWTNPAQAARAFADQYEATQRAIATKAEIGSRREATSMNTASQAVKEANRLRIELDKSREYSTIKRMQLLTHGLHFDWRKLKAATVKLGADSIDVFDANYGTVKAYRADVWLEAYGLDISGGCYA